MTFKPYLTLITTLLCGCGPQDAGTDGTTTEAGSTSTAGASTSTAADTTMATAEPTTGSVEPTTGTVEPTTGTIEPTTGDTDTLSCEPPPLVGDACAAAGETKGSFYLEIDGQAFVETFDAMCSVESVDDVGETETLTLACDGEVAVLQMTSAAPHVPVVIEVGAMVHLQLTNFFTLEVLNHAFALRDADERLLAAGLKNAILPQPAPLQLAPLSIELVASDCEVADDGCFVTQRAGLSVTMDGMTAVVFDGNTANLGLQDGFQILVGRATRELCVGDCEFNAEPWGTDALLVFTPEG